MHSKQLRRLQLLANRHSSHVRLTSTHFHFSSFISPTRLFFFFPSPPAHRFSSFFYPPAFSLTTKPYIRCSECRRSMTAQPQYFTDFDTMKTSALSGQCRFMLVSGPQRRLALNGHCGVLVDTGEPVTARSIGFVVPARLEHEPELKKSVLEIQERNELPSLQEFLDAASTCDREAFPTLSFRRLRMFFFLAFSACSVMCFVMLLDPPKPRNRDVDMASSTAPLS